MNNQTTIQTFPDTRKFEMRIFSNSIRFDCYTQIPPKSFVNQTLAVFGNANTHLYFFIYFSVITEDQLMPFADPMITPHLTLWLPPAIDLALLEKVAKNIVGTLLLASEMPEHKLITVAKNIRSGSQLIFHAGTPWENVKLVARNINSLAILGVQSTGYTLDQLTELARIMKFGSELLLHTLQDNENLIAVAKNMNDGAIFSVFSSISKNQMTVLAQNMKISSTLSLRGKLNLLMLITVAKNMNPGSIFLIRSDITRNYLEVVAKSMNAGSILSLHSDMDESNMEVAAQKINAGAALSLSQGTSKSTLLSVARKMKSGSIFFPPSNIDAETLKEVAENIADDVRLLILPTTDEDKLNILREFTEVGKFLSPPNMNESKMHPPSVLLQSASTSQENLKTTFWSEAIQTPLLFKSQKTEYTTGNGRGLKPEISGKFHKS